MKHSKKEKKPKGFSKGRSNDRKRQGPIMIEEILDQVNVTVAIANWEGVGRKASARDNRKGLK
jgi:ribosomal protein S25